jgi:UPF0176 protein
MSINEINRDATPFVVAALYKFTTLNDCIALRDKVLAQLKRDDIRGTLLLAEEGINGTIAGTKQSVEAFLDWLQADQRFAGIDYKLSYHSAPPFHRTKVKLKKEIVTMGIDGIDPNDIVGTYVEPQDWNALVNDPDTIVIDTRNEYEYGIGSFENAINPHTETFREFPAYVEKNLDPTKHKKVAMFCTGGIRCEKASAYMKQQGFEEVYHLKGGVLKYLEHVDNENSLWNGECFVFDDRVAVDQNLDKGSYDQCHACRYPITEQQKESPHYIPGVSCPRCYENLTEDQKERFKERERQVQLAKLRGESHIGIDSRTAADKNRDLKHQDKENQRNK